MINFKNNPAQIMAKEYAKRMLAGYYEYLRRNK